MMARKRPTLTDLLNDLTFKVIHNKYKMLAQTAFEWEGLPDTVQAKHIERYLYEHGKAIFFKDPKKSFMCLEAQDGRGINVQGDPVTYWAIGHQYHELYKADECVIIENNPLRLNTDDFVMMYVNKLTEGHRTMDVNVKRCKTPYIIACDDNDVLTFKRIFQEIDGNVPAIYADKGLNLDALSVLNTKAEFLCNDLMDYNRSVENELITFLGFNNLAVDKKERTSVSEVNANNQLIESFADLQLKSRELACEHISELFRVEVKVKRRHSPIKDMNKGDVENVENTSV